MQRILTLMSLINHQLDMCWEKVLYTFNFDHKGYLKLGMYLLSKLSDLVKLNDSIYMEKKKNLN